MIPPTKVRLLGCETCEKARIHYQHPETGLWICRMTGEGHVKTG